MAEQKILKSNKSVTDIDLTGFVTQDLSNVEQGSPALTNADLLDGVPASNYQTKLKQIIFTTTCSCTNSWGSVYWADLDISGFLPTNAQIVNVGIKGNWYFTTIHISYDQTLRLASPQAYTNKSQTFVVWYIEG